MYMLSDPEPTEAEKYSFAYHSYLRKANHLASRMKQFRDDLNKTNLSKKDKHLIENATLTFFDDIAKSETNLVNSNALSRLAATHPTDHDKGFILGWRSSYESIFSIKP